MRIKKILALMLTIVMIFLLFVQPVLALTVSEGETTEETHEGSGSSGGRGGNGQGGSGSHGGSGGHSGSGGSGSHSGSGSSGGGTDDHGNKVNIYVTVEWPLDATPTEVTLSLYSGEEIYETIQTIDCKATFQTTPGDEWILVGEAVPGYIVPIEPIAIKGTGEDVEVTLTYVSGEQEAEEIVLNKTNLELFIGDSSSLTAVVFPLNASNKNITWNTSSQLVATVDNGLVTAISGGNAVITAVSLDNPEITASCNVTVYEPQSAIHVTSIDLNTDTINLDLGENKTYQLTAVIEPENATVKDVSWYSSNNSVADVDENGLVTAKSPGTAYITVETTDGSKKAYTLVSVVPSAEISYIFPCLLDDDDAEHFNNPKDVYINVVNLVSKLESDGLMTESGVKYFVKVTEKGSENEPLGEGIIFVKSGMEKFNLYDITLFEETDNYSERYYVYMSTFPDYPKDDEKTLMTNFMGEESTPTIPVENVDVNLVMVGGNLSTEGIVFLLAREELFGKTVEEITWRDFYTVHPPINPYPVNGNNGVDVDSFVDEVKMVGITNSQGIVEWIPPRETLKLGGYLLLEVTPLGYMDNLNMLSPDSDDGEMIKQVHLFRDGSIDVTVTNIYVGGEDDTPGGNPSEDDNPESPGDDDNPGAPGDDDNPGTPTKSDSDNAKLVSFDFVTLEYLEKFEGHWAKKYIDNVVQEKKLSKNVFDTISDLNDSVLFKDMSILNHIMDNNGQTEYKFGEGCNIPITRQQGIIMIMSSFGFEPAVNPILNFKDSHEIEENAKGYISVASELGIISGYPDNTFKPNHILTKAELLTIISKCLDVK